MLLSSIHLEILALFKTASILKWCSRDLLLSCWNMNCLPSEWSVGSVRHIHNTETGLWYTTFLSASFYSCESWSLSKEIKWWSQVRFFNLIAMIWVARVTSVGSLSQIYLMHNLLKLFYIGFRIVNQDTDIILLGICFVLAGCYGKSFA